MEIGPDYAELRARCPVAKVQLPYGGDAWLVTRHADVKSVLSDTRFSRKDAAAADRPRFFPQPVIEGLGVMDPPEQTRLRRLLSRAFTARKAEAFRPRIEAIVDELLTQVIDAGPPVDLAEDFAYGVPGRVVCEFMGVPYEDHPRFEPFFDAVVSTTAVPPEEIIKARTALEEYFTELIAARRREPTDDLYTALIRARYEDDKLSEKELIELGFGILVAGLETTGSLILNFLYVLFSHPEQLAALRARPELVPNAVEELLRYIPLLGVGVPATATEDVEIGGTLVREGETVVPSLNSANRDEDVFTDPHRLDITRESNPHLAFSNGFHHCLGSRLARLELQIVLTEMVTRFDDLAPAVPLDSLEWKAGMVVRGVRSMPVTWKD